MSTIISLLVSIAKYFEISVMHKITRMTEHENDTKFLLNLKYLELHRK